MLQEPLEEGDAVKFSARLQCLLYGLGLTLLTVAQQRVQQLSHPPLPLPKSLDHCWELKEHTVITHFDNKKKLWLINFNQLSIFI